MWKQFRTISHVPQGDFDIGDGDCVSMEMVSVDTDWREDGNRGQTKGQTRAVGQRGEAQTEVGNDEEFKGRKRHRGRKGRTAKGKRLTGDGSLRTAEGSTGTGVAGGGDGTDSGGTTKNTKNNGCELASPSHDNGGSATGEGQQIESEGLGGGSRDRVGRADLAGGDEVGPGIGAPRGEAEEIWREAHTGDSSQGDVEGQKAAEVCEFGGATDAGIGRGVGVGGATGQGWKGCAGGASVSSRNREDGWLRGAGAVETGGSGAHRVGHHRQAEDQQGDTGEGGALQAGAEEHLQGTRQGNGGAIVGD